MESALPPVTKPADADALPCATAFDLQDDLLVVCNDLDRLKGLLSGACIELAAGFHSACELIASRREQAAGSGDAEFLDELHRQLATTITALQFEDMATQLIAHTRRVLRSGADRLAAETFGGDDGEAVIEEHPRRANPVTQDEMDAGSVEMF